ncbi:hypothetical protein LEP1GSC021_4497 [Leptospira noguchii str. 1993005606]|nr:hypothetical protein LEP1GSC021_4497 [Leptospira noguchii str. 1993005606]
MLLELLEFLKNSIVQINKIALINRFYKTETDRGSFFNNSIIL